MHRRKRQRQHNKAESAPTPNKTAQSITNALKLLAERRDSLKGPDSLLLYKSLGQEMKKLTEQLYELDKSKLTEHVTRLETLERSHGQHNRKPKLKEISTDTRLFPPNGTNRRQVTLSRTSVDSNREVRALKKQLAIGYNLNTVIPERSNALDVCVDCGIDKVVDRETALVVCPRCARNSKFPSHVFDVKEDVPESQAQKQQSTSHMEKYSQQFERGYPCVPRTLMESLSVHYQKIHLHDPSKVQTCRTSAFMKEISDTPKIFRKAPDRVTKELKRESIPEYTSSELKHLLHQRNQLRTHDDTDQRSKKSFSNQNYMRLLGRANGKEQSRLFQHAKTVKIHTERTRAMEQECEYQHAKTGNQPNAIWSLYPST